MVDAAIDVWLQSWRDAPEEVAIMLGINDIGNANGETYSQAVTLAKHASIRAKVRARASGARIRHWLLPPVGPVYMSLDAGRIALNAALLDAYPDDTIDGSSGFVVATMTVDDLHTSLAGAQHLAAAYLAVAP
jgi:lysophospholipase L1-like esterase